MTVYSIPPRFTAAAAWAPAPFSLSLITDDEKARADAVKALCKKIYKAAGIEPDGSLSLGLTMDQADRAVKSLAQMYKDDIKRLTSVKGGKRQGRKGSDNNVSPEDFVRYDDHCKFIYANRYSTAPPVVVPSDWANHLYNKGLR